MEQNIENIANTLGKIYDYISVFFCDKPEFLISVAIGVANVVILFFTYSIICKYTEATEGLLREGQKQTEEEQKQTNFEMKPYLRLQWCNKSNCVFQIVNDGRGVAIDIEFDKVKLKDFMDFNIKNRPVISASGYSDISEEELFLSLKNRAPEFRGKIRDMFKSYFDTEEIFYIKITYNDIENNKYEAKFAFDLKYNDKFKIVYQERIDKK